MAPVADDALFDDTTDDGELLLGWLNLLSALRYATITPLETASDTLAANDDDAPTHTTRDAHVRTLALTPTTPSFASSNNTLCDGMLLLALPNMCSDADAADALLLR